MNKPPHLEDCIDLRQFMRTVAQEMPGDFGGPTTTRVPRDCGDDEWRLRFLTNGDSLKVADIRRNARVSVIFQHDADDVFVAVTGIAGFVEDKAGIRKRRTSAYDAVFPAGPDHSGVIFVTIDVACVELWIRGLTAEPFGLRTTVIERDAASGWQFRAG